MSPIPSVPSKVVRAWTALLALGLLGCSAQLLNDQFDFFLGESRVTLLPGGSTVQVPVRVATGESVDPQCGWDFEDLPTGVNADIDLEPGSTCADFTLRLSADATAAVGPAEVTVVGRATYYGGLADDVTEELSRTLVVEIAPTVRIRITAPSDGLTTIDDDVELAVEVVDPLHGIGEITFRVADGPWQLICSSGCSATTPGGTTYTGDEIVSLVEGANRLIARAENVLGHTAEDTVTVTYQPVTSGTSRWDGEAGDGLWTTALNWDSDVVPGPGDDVVIDAPGTEIRLAVPDAAVVQSLALEAGTLAVQGGELRLREASTAGGDLVIAPAPGPGPGAGLTLLDALRVSGSLECSGTGRIGGGTVEVEAGASARFEACVLSGTDITNRGDATVAGTLALSGTTALENGPEGGLTLVDGSIICEGTGCTGGIVNHGTLRIAGFLGTVDLPLENAGTLEMEATSVDFAGGLNQGTITSTSTSLGLSGDWSLESGSTLETASVFVAPDRTVTVGGTWAVGSLQVESGAEVRLAPSASLAPAEEITISGGSLELGSNVAYESEEVTLFSGRIEVDAGGILYARSRLRWSGGTLVGPGSTRVITRLTSDPEPILLWDGDADRSLDGHRLLVVGQTYWSGGDVLGGNGAEFNHAESVSGAGSGLVRVQSDNAFRGDALGGGIAVWRNQGVIRKEAGTGETLIDGCYEAPGEGQIVENSGTVRVEVRCSS